MSNTAFIIEERAATIGNFMVGRLLPFREKRSVGPFVFVDHMGPADIGNGDCLDVAPHPHIGLATLTYLFEGAILHRDSTGVEQEILPGAVNLMTAGKGVVHSERTPMRLRGVPSRLHGLQIWIALPKAEEEREPSFEHTAADALPSWKDGELAIRLVAGNLKGRTSPVTTYSPLFFVELKTGDQPQIVEIGSYLFGESALYILQGNVQIEGTPFGSKQILIAKESTLCSFEMAAHSTVFIFGGEPFPEPRYIDWNFVSSSKERINTAKTQWTNGEFPLIVGETGRVPYPSRHS